MAGNKPRFIFNGWAAWIYVRRADARLRCVCVAARGVPLLAVERGSNPMTRPANKKGSFFGALFIGWGAWIRTRTKRVRAARCTVKLRPTEED